MTNHTLLCGSSPGISLYVSLKSRLCEFIISQGYVSNKIAVSLAKEGVTHTLYKRHEIRESVDYIKRIQ